MDAENLFLGACEYPCNSTNQLRHVCMSVRLYQRGTHWADFREIWHWGFLWKSVEEIKIWL